MRGVKALIKSSAPGKLVKRGKFACFRARTASNRPTGPKLRGITKLLTKKLYSSATPPSTGSWRGGAWRGGAGRHGRERMQRACLCSSVRLQGLERVV